MSNPEARINTLITRIQEIDRDRLPVFVKEMMGGLVSGTWDDVEAVLVKWESVYVQI